jgi:type VI secretion system secreted protein VgrG
MALLGQDIQVFSPLKPGTLLLETFQGKEALGSPYRYDLTLLSDDPNIPVTKLLGQPLTIRITLNSGLYRYFNGTITYFAKTGLAMHHARYSAIINPKITLFDYTRDCRIFNDVSNFDPDPEGKKSSQDILSIITSVLADRGFTDVESGSIKDHVYRDRKYCVQYRETDLNFVQRLLEEEGIYYFFKHEEKKHILVLANSSTAHAKVSGYENILFVPRHRKVSVEEEHFWSLNVSGALYPGDYTVVRGYDYTKERPRMVQSEKKASLDELPGATYEDYDYPGGLSEKSDAESEATVRMQMDYVANTIIEAEGNTMGLGVGDLISLKKPESYDSSYNPFWNDGDFKKEYLITSATYSISVNQFETGDTTDSDDPYKATYTLLDSHSQFRPRRSAVKPRIEGPQTAIVVGSSGDEIYTDKLGRVKVQFDWDRIGERNQKSSCWVRVSQVWAGQKWGAIHIPRVGQEVIVEFLDGDPDRPVITGRLYNKDNMPPYDLPKHMTQSGIKSRSSKGGTPNNFNEIRFEDEKGKEEFHIQAEKDMSTLVKANESISVGGDRSISVTGNQSTTIEGKGKSAIHCSTKVTGKYDLDVSDTIHIIAPTSITLECKGSKIEMLPGKITLTAGDGAQVVLDANALTQAKDGGYTKHTADVHHESKGKAKIMLDANAFMEASGGGKVLLDANVLAESKGGSKVVLDATSALMEGKVKATVKGVAEATLTATGSVKTSPAGVEASGAMVKLNS